MGLVYAQLGVRVNFLYYGTNIVKRCYRQTSNSYIYSIIGYPSSTCILYTSGI